ncbi:MAG TPA: hypothetical protein VNW92_06075, partial [Polyangiaceae bacterium]|nr:hypothetical protein [Polyangiaceae bacterium]
MRHPKFALQRHELIQTEVTPLTGAQIFGGHASVRDAHEAHDQGTGRLTQTPNLAVPSFSQGELQPSLVPFEAQSANFGGRGGTAVDLDALPPLEQLVVLNQALHFGDVHLLRFVSRMRE